MREDKSFQVSLYIKFTLMVWGGVLLLYVAGGAALLGLYYMFDVDIQFSENTWLLVSSLFIGGVFTLYIGKKFLAPISELGRAMSRVAKGDFNTELDSKSKIKEIGDIYNDFNLMVKELRATEILQTDFVSNVSHEFKTPITAIEGYAMLLQDCDEGVTSQQQEYIEKIVFNSQRMTALVGNILLLSKLDNQAIPAASEEFRLDEQIRRTVFSFESEWSRKKIDFDVDLESVNFFGNEAVLSHIWSNLIGNAIKFSPNQGVIRIALMKQVGNVIFIVEDEGPGISDKNMAHIFDRFYQGDTSHKQEGNGLGLALAKQIVTKYDGTVAAENIEGGSRFTVTLPC